MSTNKEQIEQLEQVVGSLQVQEEIQRLGLGFGDRMQRLEDSLRAIPDAVLTPQPRLVSASAERGNNSRNFHDETDQVRPATVLFRTKVDCLPYLGKDDTAEWFNRLEQFFEKFRNFLENRRDI